MDLTRGRRQLQFSDKEFIQNLQTTGFVPVVAHRVQSSLKGGQHLVTGSKTDFKNHARNVRYCVADADAQMYCVADADAQMIVDRFTLNMSHLEDFFFQFKVVDGVLWSILWSDDVSRCNYNMFGEVLAFDTTYSTNRHDMIFVPFTGVDCHKKCVTFAHGKQPRLVFTDQDPAMKQAVSSVLNESTHTLCMWHVTNKILVKLKGEIQVNEEIRCHVNKLGKLGSGLLRDIPMCCLIKTTSCYESSNSQFKVYSSPGNNLVQFMNCFEMALNARRHVQRELQNDTTTKAPPLETRLPIEHHASYVYTITIFKAKGLYHCARTRVDSADGLNIHLINHNDKRNGFVGEFKVTQNPNDNTFSCSCKGFTRIGYLCRHIFKVLQIELIDEIPDKYIPYRWRNDVIPSSFFKIETRYGVPLDERSKLRQQFFSLTNQCANRARGNIELLQSSVDQMN
ncbi:protein FAR1-RELATED SEQUENCE 5-like [Bidens hawaiensis]|uniref:protein FAR1-RELATED SEQUENCE 5-like n=1 Tax=Bidens hawaiensis TaxID=980011 RepID=UPI00404B1874